MAHLTDVFNVGGTVQFGRLSGHTTGEINTLLNIPPPPGDSDTGSIVGAIIDLVGGIIGGRVPSTPTLPPLPGGRPPTLQQIPTSVQGGAFPLAAIACPTQACCKGEHLNKSRGCDGAPPGSKCVKNRRMNALNPRALRRATRRLKGFESAVKSTRKQLRTLSRI